MPNDAVIFAALVRHAVPFIVVGGHAVNFHGHPRGTEDVDVVWLRSPASEAALLAALTELNAVYIGDSIDPATGIERTYPVTATYIRVEHLMMLWTDAGYLDLFDYIPGDPLADVRQLFETAVEGRGMRFASIAWLTHMKTAAGRSKDLDDLREIAKVQEQRRQQRQ